MPRERDPGVGRNRQLVGVAARRGDRERDAPLIVVNRMRRLAVTHQHKLVTGPVVVTLICCPVGGPRTART